MPLTPLPEAPSRADPSSFAARGDAFLGALPTLATEINALLPVIESANALAPTSLAAVNYKGAWSSLTGSLAIPASVSHSGKFWMLLSSVANVATKTPGVAAEWQDISPVTLDGTQTLTNKNFQSNTFTGQSDVQGSVRSTAVAVAALNIDCSLSNYFTKTVSASSTFTFSNAPASRAYSFLLRLTHTSGTVTWPASVRWQAALAPVLSTGKTHLFGFTTDDGGTTWRGVALVDFVN